MCASIEVEDCKINPKNASGRRFPMQFLCDWAGVVLDEKIGELMENRHLLRNPACRQVWGKASDNEIGRLAQGIKGRVEGTDAMHFIKKENAPQDRKKDATYGKFACDLRPQKQEKERAR